MPLSPCVGGCSVASSSNCINWTDILCCAVCTNSYDCADRKPITLNCSHTVCAKCAHELENCPLDQAKCAIAARKLPFNRFLLSIIESNKKRKEGGGVDMDMEKLNLFSDKQEIESYLKIVNCLQSVAHYFHKANAETGGSVYSASVSRPMQRKVLALACCQFLEVEGRLKALKHAKALAERVVTEMLLLHQNPNHLSSNLWSAVRARGCQFLGPAMQEEVLKLILLTLSEGASIARKTLVLYIVQTLAREYPQASKTSVGHVVQLLYRASCFNVMKRDGESSLMQLKEQYRTYEELRREHDTQIVQMANEARLRISPDQWSSLLYGDQTHRSHMQSIIDKLQSPEAFKMSIQDLATTINKFEETDFGNDFISDLLTLSNVDVPDDVHVTYEMCYKAVNAACNVLHWQIKHAKGFTRKSVPSTCRYTNQEDNNYHPQSVSDASRYKTCMCREVLSGKPCPRGKTCTFAHSYEEVQTHRNKSRITNSVTLRPTVPQYVMRPPIPANMNITTRMPPPLAPLPPPSPIVDQQQQFVQYEIVPPPSPTPQNFVLQPILNQEGQQAVPFPSNPLNPLMQSFPPGMMSVPATGINEHGEVSMGTLYVPVHAQPPIVQRHMYMRTPSSESDVEREVLPHMMAKRDEILRRLTALHRSSDDEDERCSSAELASHVSWACAISVLDVDDSQIYVPTATASPIMGPNPMTVAQQPPPLPTPSPTPGESPQGSAVDATDGDGRVPRNTNCYLPTTGVVRNTMPHSWVHTSNVLTQTVVTPTLLPQNVRPPLASFEAVNPINIAYHLPPVMKSPHHVSQQQAVGCSIDRIVEVKNILNSPDMLNPPSNVEKQHYKMELKIMNQQLKTMDRPTEAACLVRELQRVTANIDQMKYV